MKNDLMKNNCNNLTIAYKPDNYYFTACDGLTSTTVSTYVPQVKAHQPGMFKMPCDQTLCRNVYIREVIYNNPATIVLWSDGTKTVTKCAKGDKYNRETGLTLCILKKLVGPTKMHEVLENWCPQDAKRVTLTDVRKRNR